MLRFSNKPPEMVFLAVCKDGPAGPLALGLTEDAELCRVSFGSVKAALRQWRKEWPKTCFADSKEKLPFAGLERLSLLLVGTSFQQKVWRELAKLKSGRTLSYGELAKRIGKPGAARSIGGAMGANPVPVFIPCHRVLAAGGALGGYSGGLKIKKKLLDYECRKK